MSNSYGKQLCSTSTPPPTPPPTQPLPPPLPSGAEAEYKSLVSTFKNLVWVTGIGLSIITLAATVLVAIGSYFFWANLRDVRQDAREQAGHAATEEAHKKVSEAFEEKNLKAVIQQEAERQVKAVTDKVIEQQLSSKLQPIQDRIIIIGRISECEARIHTGFRSGLVELNTILREAKDPTVHQFALSTLTTTTEGYDSFWQASPQWQAAIHWPQEQLMALLSQVRIAHGAMGSVSDLGGVVRVINEDQDLNNVAVATLIFRQITGDKGVKMFDFAAVNTWCASHEPQCKKTGK